MTEEGTLSIVRRAHTYQVRYASNNPYDCDRPPQQCSDEGTLVAFLHQCGLHVWYITQAVADLRKGELVVLPIVFSHEQMQACFPSPPETREGKGGRQTGPPPPTQWQGGATLLGTRVAQK
jgi:hypothetical protein